MRVARQLAAAALTLVVTAGGLQGAQAARDEYELKAAFLVNFTRFVEWPRTRFSADADPLVVCLFKDNPFEGQLGKVSRTHIGGHPVRVQRLSDPGEAHGCHVLFLPASQNRRLQDLVSVTGGNAVLLVGEAEGFAAEGGMINFVLRDEHVRFEINPKAAAASGLKISSNLLQLAIIVGDGRR